MAGADRVTAAAGDWAPRPGLCRDGAGPGRVLSCRQGAAWLAGARCRERGDAERGSCCGVGRAHAAVRSRKPPGRAGVARAMPPAALARNPLTSSTVEVPRWIPPSAQHRAGPEHERDDAADGRRHIRCGLVPGAAAHGPDRDERPDRAAGLVPRQRHRLAPPAPGLPDRQGPQLSGSGSATWTTRRWPSELACRPPEVSAWRWPRGRRARLRVPRGSVSCR